jgi:2,4-dienoyl-CoA reductase-like NADH-dependent reductase (Old Yellow Enzyme family)
MSVLFENYQIGHLLLRNRFVRSATGDNLVNKKGLPTDAMIKWYRAMAENGVAMINTGMVKPRSSWISVNRAFSLALTQKSQISAYKRLTDSVHELGGLVTAQMTAHFFRNGERLAPSRILELGDVKEASLSDIHRVVRIYGELGAFIREANFDAIQVHAAHGYALHQFLSPFFNRRNDQYGGSTENRFRIIAEIRREIARMAGKEFPVWIKLTTGDFFEGGMDIDESVSMAQLAEKENFFAIEPSCGSLLGNWKSRGPIDKKKWKEGYLIDRTARIKQAVKIPVVAVGGLRNFNEMERLIQEGKCDLIALCRPFIREPNLIQRWKSGDLSPSQCISCDGCFKTYVDRKPIRCVLNPEYWDSLLK